MQRVAGELEGPVRKRHRTQGPSEVPALNGPIKSEHTMTDETISYTLIRDANYYDETADCTILVETTLFKVNFSPYLPVPPSSDLA